MHWHHTQTLATVVDIVVAVVFILQFENSIPAKRRTKKKTQIKFKNVLSYVLCYSFWLFSLVFPFTCSSCWRIRFGELFNVQCSTWKLNISSVSSLKRKSPFYVCSNLAKGSALFTKQGRPRSLQNRLVIYCKLLFPSPFLAHWRRHRAVTYNQYAPAVRTASWKLNSNKFSNKSVITNSLKVHRLDVDTSGACLRRVTSLDCSWGVRIFSSWRISQFITHSKFMVNMQPNECESVIIYSSERLLRTCKFYPRA